MPPAKLKLPPSLMQEVSARPPAAPREAPPEDFGKRLRAALVAIPLWCRSNLHVFLSAGVHVLILALLGVIVFSGSKPPPKVDLETLFDRDPPPIEAFSTVSDHPALELPKESDEEFHRRPLAGGVIDPTATMPGLGGLVAGIGNSLDGDDQGGGKDIDVKGSFFGTGAEGMSFVYIVDNSGSMTENGRWGRAISELGKSVAKLKAHQKFYVFFFNDKTHRMFESIRSVRPGPRRLISATPENKNRAQRWFRHEDQEPGGLTNPEVALEEALAMQPEVIFLLTDGEFGEPEDQQLLIARIAKLNTNKTVIHTIALQNEAGAACLEEIAKQNRGTYRLVK